MALKPERQYNRQKRQVNKSHFLGALARLGF